MKITTETVRRISLLQEVVENTANRHNSYGLSGTGIAPQLVILGSEQVGKTRLITNLLESGEAHTGFGLEFHCTTFQDENAEGPLQLNIWCLDGDTEHSNLLKFALTADNIWHTMLVVCLSLTEPWSMVDDLKLWLKIVQQHVVRLKLAAGELHMLQSTIEDLYRDYKDPSKEKSEQPNAADSGRPITTSGRRLSTSMSFRDGQPEWPYSPLHPILVKKDKSPEESEDTVIPSNPLGIPVLVVVTKADMNSTLERENGFNDEHFDCIQFHLRKICLQYRAGLIYVSTKDGLNIELLKRYVKHRLYGHPFNSSAVVCEPTELFIPSGWDNEHRMAMLEKNLPENSVGDYFFSSLPRPTKFRGSSKGKNAATDKSSDDTYLTHTVEDEQVFLARLQTQLASPVQPGSVPSIDVKKVSGGPSEKPPPSRPSMIGATGQQQASLGEKEAVLSSFFSSLLTRKSQADMSSSLSQRKSVLASKSEQTATSHSKESDRKCEQIPKAADVDNAPNAKSPEVTEPINDVEQTGEAKMMAEPVTDDISQEIASRPQSDAGELSEVHETCQVPKENEVPVEVESRTEPSGTGSHDNLEFSDVSTDRMQTDSEGHAELSKEVDETSEVPKAKEEESTEDSSLSLNESSIANSTQETEGIPTSVAQEAEKDETNPQTVEVEPTEPQIELETSSPSPRYPEEQETGEVSVGLDDQNNEKEGLSEVPKTGDDQLTQDKSSLCESVVSDSAMAMEEHYATEIGASSADRKNNILVGESVTPEIETSLQEPTPPEQSEYITAQDEESELVDSSREKELTDEAKMTDPNSRTEELLDEPKMKDENSAEGNSPEHQENIDSTEIDDIKKDSTSVYTTEASQEDDGGATEKEEPHELSETNGSLAEKSVDDLQDRGSEESGENQDAERFETDEIELNQEKTENSESQSEPAENEICDDTREYGKQESGSETQIAFEEHRSTDTPTQEYEAPDTKEHPNPPKEEQPTPEVDADAGLDTTDKDRASILTDAQLIQQPEAPENQEHDGPK